MTEIELARAKCRICEQAAAAAFDQLQHADDRWWAEAQALPSRQAARRALEEYGRQVAALREAEALVMRRIREELDRLAAVDQGRITTVLSGGSIAEICAAGDAARARTGDET